MEKPKKLQEVEQKKLRIYISGKITGLKLEVAQEYFEMAEARITLAGHIPVNPMKVMPYKPELTWHDYMAADLAALLHCDAILMLENWKDSKGAKIELAVALVLELLVIYHNSYLNIEEVLSNIKF